MIEPAGEASGLVARVVRGSARRPLLVDLMREGRLPSRGVVRPEDVPLDVFLANRFGQYYG